MTKQPTDNNQVVGLLRGRVKTGDEVVFKSLRGIITAKEVESGLAEIRFFGKPMEVLTVLAKEGLTPLPPYIQSPLSEKDRARRYQTVYARQPGSCAAPTAGLHFTPKLLKRIEDRGVQIAKINLQVGFGTFLPVRNENLLKRELHEEEYEIDYDNALLINTALSSRRRIVAVGTTTTRCLESAVFKRLGKDRVRNGRGITRLFIMPGYRFRVVSAMITNFHLPRSSLLYLVCAFASRPNTKADLVEFKSSLIGRAYQEAVLNEYRFYSFGDAMLIL
jgi:S-adenosylmethionine:tRNA ribosyltransferase-isomerase